MATLFRRSTSKHWWIRYTKDGNQIRESTGTSSKAKAMLRLREIELVLGQYKENGTVSQHLVSAIQTESITEFPIKDFLANQCQFVSEKTSGLYASQHKRFLSWLAKQHPGMTMLSEVTPRVIKDFLDTVRTSQSARTFNSYLRRLRAAFNAAVKEGYAVTNPTSDIAFQKEVRSCRRSFTDEELRTLFSGLAGPVRLLTTFGLYAGALRLQDITSLRWRNVDLKAGAIRWGMHKRDGKPMEIALHPRIKKDLQALGRGKESDPIFPEYFNNTRKATDDFHDALIEAGLAENRRREANRRYERRQREKKKAKEEGREYEREPIIKKKNELDFHALRYNFVSILKADGCPEAIARSIMGHASAEVNAIYTQLDPASERKWIVNLPDVTETE